MKYKNRLIAAAAVIAVLVFAFWWGGNSESLHGFGTDKAAVNTNEFSEQTAAPSVSAVTPTENMLYTPAVSSSAIPNTEIPEISTVPPSAIPTVSSDTLSYADTLASEPDNTAAAPDASEPPQTEIQTETQTELIKRNDKTVINSGSDDVINTEINKQNPAENKENYCTLSVSCRTVLDKPSQKIGIIPENGVIYAPQNVVFYEGETVFNVLQRELKKNRIHLEFSKTPAYNSYYIEGINNIYEFDFGELSGWMYSVNGIFPDCSASEYTLKDGDVISWVYTCDLGRDVGKT